METNTKKASSYLTFKIGDEEYAAHVNEVLNILEMQHIIKVPKSPDYMKGVIDLRGSVLPVIDTRLKFEMTPTVFTDHTCIIVMDLQYKGELIHIGALVDSVVAVLEIENETIEPAPSIGEKYKTEFISGIAKADDHFIMILDLVKLFTSEDIKDLKKAQKK